MRRIKDDAISGLANPIKRAHIGDEIIVAKGCSALGETEFFVAEGDEFVGNVSHIQWREELTFFYIDRAIRLRSGTQQIGLSAKKRRDLQHVDLSPGDPGFRRRVNIGCDRNLQVAANGRKNLATLAHSNSAKRTYGCSIRFVIGRFENEIDICIRADLRDFFRHPPDELLRFDHARPENKHGTFPTDRDFADAQWSRIHNI